MKKSNANGQVLSEQEMKAVKGGHVTTRANVVDLTACDGCGFPLVGMIATSIAGVGFCVKCPNCQSIIEVDVVQEED